jgi:hypothetical protein
MGLLRLVEAGEVVGQRQHEQDRVLRHHGGRAAGRAAHQQPALEHLRPRRLVQPGVVAVHPAQPGRAQVALVEVAADDRDLGALERPPDLGRVVGADHLLGAEAALEPLDQLGRPLDRDESGCDRHAAPPRP